MDFNVSTWGAGAHGSERMRLARSLAALNACQQFVAERGRAAASASMSAHLPSIAAAADALLPVVCANAAACGDSATLSSLTPVAGAISGGVDPEAVEAASQARKAAAAHELAVARDSSSREGSHAAYMKLGRLLLDSGDFENAASNFSFANDVASTSSQNLAASAGLLETSFVRGRLREAAATALSIELSIEPSAAANGESHLSRALKALAQVQQNICAQDTSSTLLPTLQLLTSPGAPDKLSVHNALLARLVHPDDLAFYICLNAVLHMSRAEIRSKCLEQPGARLLADFCPRGTRLLSLFLGAKYAAAMEALHAMLLDMLLDSNLSKQVAAILRTARMRCYEQYLIPFSRADLPSMAAAFHVSVDELVSDVLQLIADGKLRFRVDMAAQVLVPLAPASAVDVTLQAYELASTLTDEVSLLLLRDGMSKALVSVMPGQRAGNASLLRSGSHGSHVRTPREEEDDVDMREAIAASMASHEVESREKGSADGAPAGAPAAAASAPGLPSLVEASDPAFAVPTMDQLWE